MVHFVLLFNMLKKLTVQSKSSQQGILEGSKMVFQKKTSTNILLCNMYLLEFCTRSHNVS